MVTARYAIGIDVGGSSIKAGMVDGEGLEFLTTRGVITMDEFQSVLDQLGFLAEVLDSVPENDARRRLVEALGAEVDSYSRELDCCGGAGGFIVSSNFSSSLCIQCPQ